MTKIVKNENDSPQFDDLFLMVGGFGRCSILLYSFMCIVSIPIGCQLLAQVFYGATPTFQCITATPGNASCQVGKCCANCTAYQFSDVFSSVVSEVSQVYNIISCSASMVLHYHLHHFTEPDVKTSSISAKMNSLMFRS